MADAPRRCSATTKRGKPCANPVVLETGLCLAHDREAATTRGFGGVEAGKLGGRPRLLRSIEILQQLENDRAEELGRVHLEIAADPSMEPALRMRALEYIHDRLAGKPVAQSDVNVTGDVSASVFFFDDLAHNTDGDA